MPFIRKYGNKDMSFCCIYQTLILLWQTIIYE